MQDEGEVQTSCVDHADQSVVLLHNTRSRLAMKVFSAVCSWKLARSKEMFRDSIRQEN
jgi:hypothetical protein